MRLGRLTPFQTRAALVLALAVLLAALAACALALERLDRSVYIIRGAWPPDAGPEPAVTIDTGLEIPDRVGGLIAANLDGDGRRDFVITTPGRITAFGAGGDRLWSRSDDIRLSSQAEVDGLPGLHAPGVQIADLEADGMHEFLYLTQAGALVVLDAASGRLRSETLLPSAPQGAERWEHLVVASFRAHGSVDLLLQATGAQGRDRRGHYLAAFAADTLLQDGAEAAPLWRRDDFLALAHGGARVADLDGDGRHEVLGGDVIGPAGDRLLRVPVEGHLDSLFVADVRPDLPGLEVVSLEETGPQYVSLYNARRVIWQTAFKGQTQNAWEPQNAAVGDFDLDRPGLEIWCRSRLNVDQRPWVLDARGEVIAHYEMADVAPRGWTTAGVEEIFPIHWTGSGRQLAAAKERHQHNDVALFEPISGAFRLRVDETAARLYVADVRDDWREEIVVLSDDGALRIYQNPAPNPDPSHPSLWERDDYARSRMTWNYYSP